MFFFIFTRIAARPSLREGGGQDWACVGLHVVLDELEHLQGVPFSSINNFYLVNLHSKCLSGASRWSR